MKIRLCEWEEGFSVIDACKFLIATTSLNLAQAKHMCEALLDGSQPEVEIHTIEEGQDIVESLRSLHVIAEKLRDP